MSAENQRRLTAHPGWWRVRDVMTTHVVRATPTTTCTQVVDLMLANGVSGVPVTDAAGRLLGVVTEADLVRREAGRAVGTVDGPPDARAGTAAELMSCPAVTASPDDDLPTTARTLLDGGIRRLPVVAADGRLVGVISRRDLLTPAWEHATAEPESPADRQLPRGHPVGNSEAEAPVHVPQQPAVIAQIEATPTRCHGSTHPGPRLADRTPGQADVVGIQVPFAETHADEQVTDVGLRKAPLDDPRT